MPVTITMYACFLSVVIMTSEQIVPSAVAQYTVVKFLTNENVKLLRFCPDSEHSLVMKHCQGFKVYDWSRHLKKARQRLKTFHM
jgi:hypothetical protein